VCFDKFSIANFTAVKCRPLPEKRLKEARRLANDKTTVELSGDLQNAPEDLPRLIAAVESGSDVASVPPQRMQTGRIVEIRTQQRNLC